MLNDAIMAEYQAININNPDEQCVYCLGDDLPLIKPCPCSLYHRECLNEVRAKGQGDAMNECLTCKFAYKIEIIDDDPENERIRIRTYRLCMARNIILYISAFIIIGSFLGLVFYEFDTDGKIYNNLSTSYITNKFIIYGLYGISMLFTLIGLAFLLLWNVRLIVVLIRHEINFCGVMECDIGVQYIIKATMLILIISNLWNICCGLVESVEGKNEDVDVFGFFGLTIAIMFGFYYIVKVVREDHRILWNLQKVDKYIVKDFYGKDAELVELRHQ